MLATNNFLYKVFFCNTIIGAEVIKCRKYRFSNFIRKFIMKTRDFLLSRISKTLYLFAVMPRVVLPSMKESRKINKKENQFERKKKKKTVKYERKKRRTIKERDIYGGRRRERSRKVKENWREIRKSEVEREKERGRS